MSQLERKLSRTERVVDEFGDSIIGSSAVGVIIAASVFALSKASVLTFSDYAKTEYLQGDQSSGDYYSAQADYVSATGDLAVSAAVALAAISYAVNKRLNEVRGKLRSPENSSQTQEQILQGEAGIDVGGF